MKTSRRGFLRLTATTVALPAVSRFALANAYPTRPVRLIVGSSGGTADFLARLMGQWLSGRLGQPFIVENRPGASSNIAAEAVVRAAPDGYTLLLVSPGMAMTASLYDKVNFVLVRDIAPVAGLIRGAPNVMEVHPSIPAKTVPEFIAYAKANPGKINYASNGAGSLLYLGGELFKTMAGIDIVHVPYRGTAPALTDLLGGQVQMMCDNISTSIEHIRSGRLRALGVTTTTRSELLPEVPTVGDFLPGFEQSAFFGIGAPRDTPEEIVHRLNTEINAGLADPKVKARLASVAGPILPGSPSDFGKFIKQETEKWGKVIRMLGIAPA
jgi:tripartite-type tricarboxylate transporter receptor subunit TctC